jgi:hypothetical protein
MEAMRVNWTDDRLDNLGARMDERFDAVDRQFGEIDRRLGRVEEELKLQRGEFAALNQRLDSIVLALIYVGGGLIAVLATAVVALIAT